MATYGTTVRRGLPRVRGGEPWPPAGDAPVAVVEAAATVAEPVEASPVAAASVDPSVAEPVEASPVAAASVDPSANSGTQTPLRRGLPRVPGGEQWPPVATAAVAATSVSSSTVAAAAPSQTVDAAPAEPQTTTVAQTAAGAAVPQTSIGGESVPLRRGLPRVAGGEPWPPAGFATLAAPAQAEHVEQLEVAEVVAPAPAAPPPAGPRAPLTVPRTVWPGASASRRPVPKPEPQRIGPFTKVQWAGAVIVGGFGLLYAAAMAVVFVRWLLSTPVMIDFLAAFPGEYHLPEGAPVGLPAWLGWQHFFNVFLMVLIIRTGITIRTEKRPAVFWAPRRDPKGKTSLTIWFHQSLDILWLVNGVVFVVLLFVTGQWMRVIPTSWEVIPNAVSAALQYVSLDWPTENGWVNYNSLQQLAYFATIFLAAPLAAITGYRMSGLWPKNAKALNKAYPVEWARAVHFPVMLYFVAFIAVHVFLVFATGALRNLNHMYAAQGSTDPTAYADNWTGFWFFVASLVVIAAAWVAARPLVLAPIARLFGTVSGR